MRLRRWSKLQKRIYAVRDPQLNLQIHCVVYRHDNIVGQGLIPRYFVTLNGEIIFDFPKDFPISDIDFQQYAHRPDGEGERMAEVYKRSPEAVSDISCALDQYLNADQVTRLTIKDYWGILDIIRAADRRVGVRQWDRLYETSSAAARKVLDARRKARKNAKGNAPTL